LRSWVPLVLRWCFLFISSLSALQGLKALGQLVKVGHVAVIVTLRLLLLIIIAAFIIVLLVRLWGVAGLLRGIRDRGEHVVQ